MKKELTRQQYLDLYYYMRLNRAVEEMMVKLFRQNKIVGGLYSSLGQEAISVGTAYALEKKDWLAPMIRNIGALLVKGVRPRDVFMQHMAKYDSPTKGKDGTSHFGDLDNLHIVSPISMLGDLIPVMTGVAMAGRYLGQKIVAMTWIGDGGSSTGVFHEGLNFAAVQKAPFVLILENNLWAYSTPAQFRLTSPPENVATYRWGSKTVKHHFCANCGCGTYSESPDWSTGKPDFDNPKVGINARLFDDFDLDAVPVTVIDGKNLW